jgi:hypothetical protein
MKVDGEIPSKSKICVPGDRDYLVILVELTQLPNSYFTIGVNLLLVEPMDDS